MGGPVAMKIVSPDIPHKTEVGGVVLGVEGAAAAEAAFERIMENAARHAPDARIDGVLISPMISGGVECILGAKIDPVFGPVVMFGLGGILTEVLRDVAFRRAPFGPDVAREMIDELKGAAVLKGARGQPPADLDALADAIAKLSLFAAANADHARKRRNEPVPRAAGPLPGARCADRHKSELTSWRREPAAAFSRRAAVAVQG